MRPRRSAFRMLLTSAAVVGLVAISTRHGLGQELDRRATRVVTSSSVPAIDGGLRRDAAFVRRAAQATASADGQFDTFPRFVPGRVIVKFTGTTRGATSRAAAARAVGAVDVEYPALGDFALLTLDAGADPMVASGALSERSDVEWAQPDYIRRPLFVPDDPFFHLQWNLMQVGMERALGYQPGGDGCGDGRGHRQRARVRGRSPSSTRPTNSD